MRVLGRLVRLLPSSLVIRISGARHKYPWLKPIFNRVADDFRHRDGVIENGPGKGLKYNPGSTAAGYLLGLAEPEFQQALVKIVKPGMVVWDLGANAGFYGVVLSHLVGPNGKVVCFEPMPAIADQVRYNAKLNGFDHMSCRTEAVGLEDGETSFVVPKGQCGTMASSSFNKPGLVIEERLEVKVRSIDSLVESSDAPIPDMIKMDIEGVEVDGLRGAVRTVQKHRPILLVECHGTNAGVAEQLEAMGYHAVVVAGGGKPIVGSHWNCHIAAVPKDSDPALLATINRLA